MKKLSLFLLLIPAIIFLLILSEKKPPTNNKNNKWQDNSTLTIYKKSLTSDGFTLYPVSGPDEIKLLNMQGEIVHQWNNIDADRARLLKNCNLLVLHGSKNRLKSEKWRDLIKRVSEYDWEGNLVWSYTSDYHIHHDVRRLDNGNTLLLLNVPLPLEYKKKIKDSLRKTQAIFSDRIIEITPEGKIVWSWNAWEHLDLEDCGSNKCLGIQNQPLDRREKKDIKDWTHINTLNIIPENKWYEQGDKRFKPGNLIILPRNFSEIMILDRETKEIIWRYNGNYKGGMIRGHEASMIPKGYPGAGNILVLDNGFDGIREESYILEINPVTKEVVWFYDAGKKFFTRARGSVQRLKNGNTLISEDRSGRVFEVTEKKEIVWEYQGKLLIIRPARYPYNYCLIMKKIK